MCCFLFVCFVFGLFVGFFFVCFLLFFCWFLFGPFPEFSVADRLRPADQNDCCKAGVDKCLNLL